MIFRGCKRNIANSIGNDCQTNWFCEYFEKKHIHATRIFTYVKCWFFMVNTYRSIYQSQTNPCCESNKQFGDWYGMCVCPCRLGRGCPQPKCHASQAILFFVDISEHCGFSLPTQARVVCLCQMNHQVVGKRYTPHETETNTPRKSSGNRSCKNISFGFNVFLLCIL